MTCFGRLEAQQVSQSQLHGDFQSEIRYYIQDSLIGAADVPEKALLNAYFSVLYSNGPFSAGARFETYQGPLIGYDPRNKGTGIPYRYASYNNNFMEITAGTFYEQFGSGMLLRAYEDRNLGYDNSIDGVRVKISPYTGVSIKGIWGTQRFFWDKGAGVVRALDADIMINELFPKLNDSKTRFLTGISMVSKYQKDLDPVYILPENVAAFGGRLKISRGKYALTGEYAYKINDPSTDNKRIYRPGQALLLNGTYSVKGMGILLGAKRIDNMSFRSDRSATGNNLNINYLPALAREQQYSFASMYPFATQANGEVGIQGQVIYTIKKNSKLGGKYGTNLTLAFDRANSLKYSPLPDSTYMGYESDFFSIGEDRYFEALSIEVRRKISQKISGVFSFVNLVYNQDVLLGHTGDPDVYAKVAIADITWRLSQYHSLKIEAQHLSTRQDKGNWVAIQTEYSIAPHWFLSLSDQYNYGHSNSSLRLHYYSTGLGYVRGANRFMLTYGRQRDGVICVGGVCRNMPAFSGLGLSITSSF